MLLFFRIHIYILEKSMLSCFCPNYIICAGMGMGIFCVSFQETKRNCYNLKKKRKLQPKIEWCFNKIPHGLHQLITLSQFYF